MALRSSLGTHDELIVVDSAPRDVRTRQVAREFGAGYVRCDEPGASRARNAGWRTARSDIVAFVDDDVRVEVGWAEAIARAAGEWPEAAFITGRVGVPEGATPEYPLALKIETEAAWLVPSTPNPIGHTANLAVRRDALERVGGFDELLGAGGRYRAAEDQDLFDRLFREGYRGRYAPEARAVHLPWRMRSDILALEWSYGIGTGARLAKLMRTERGRIGKVLDENVWSFFRNLRDWAVRRHKFLVVVACVRLVGTTLGFLIAAPRRVRNGHFRSRGVEPGARRDSDRPRLSDDPSRL